MKTPAFLIRVAICFCLSLIPLTDVENLVYSGRLALRRWNSIPSNIVVVDVDTNLFNIPQALKNIENRLAQQNPSLVVPIQNTNGLVLDHDGVVRSGNLHATEKEPSQTYLASLSLKIEPKTLVHGASGSHQNDSHLINYIGPAGTFPHCQASKCASTPGFLKDKILLLSEDGDGVPTLRTPFGEMTPAEVFANDFNTVINHHPIYPASFIERALIMLAMILIGAFYIIYYPVLVSAIAISGTGIAVVIVLFQLIFQIFDIYIPSANIGGSLLITYLIFTGYRLAFQENLQWRSLKQAQYLRELDQMKANFLSLVSHDLKTPMAKIQAVVERLRREMNQQQATQWLDLLDSIENSNNELKHYITSILNLSKIESQKVILNKKSHDINRIIQQTLLRLKPLAQQKNCPSRNTSTRFFRSNATRI